MFAHWGKNKLDKQENTELYYLWPVGENTIKRIGISLIIHFEQF